MSTIVTPQMMNPSLLYARILLHQIVPCSKRRKSEQSQRLRKERVAAIQLKFTFLSLFMSEEADGRYDISWWPHLRETAIVCHHSSCSHSARALRSSFSFATCDRNTPPPLLVYHSFNVPRSSLPQAPGQPFPPFPPFQPSSRVRSSSILTKFLSWPPPFPPCL